MVDFSLKSKSMTGSLAFARKDPPKNKGDFSKKVVASRQGHATITVGR
jgi:hypothetical protein